MASPQNIDISRLRLARRRVVGPGQPYDEAITALLCLLPGWVVEERREVAGETEVELRAPGAKWREGVCVTPAPGGRFILSRITPAGEVYATWPGGDLTPVAAALESHVSSLILNLSDAEKRNQRVV